MLCHSFGWLETLADSLLTTVKHELAGTKDAAEDRVEPVGCWG